MFPAASVVTALTVSAPLPPYVNRNVGGTPDCPTPLLPNAATAAITVRKVNRRMLLATESIRDGIKIAKARPLPELRTLFARVCSKCFERICDASATQLWQRGHTHAGCALAAPS